MNKLHIRMKHGGFYRTKVERFSTVIDNSALSMFSQNNILELIIETRGKEPDALALFFDVFSLLFIYLGAYPEIEAVKFNNNVIDTSQWARKYTTSADLFRHDLFIVNISDESINQTFINAYRQKQETAIYSLQYLASKDYEHIISDHRITLLLHVIDGLCEMDGQEREALQSEIVQKYKLNLNYSPQSGDCG